MNSINTDNIKIHESWKIKLLDEFKSNYFQELKQFLIEERSKHTIYPPSSQIFSAFGNCTFDNVKVVIIGQDPYHGEGQAHGLCFSVPKNIALPPSLKNIFKEIESDLGITSPKTGDLTSWAKQGVLMLNATLTVRANDAGSHQNKGWEIFTNNVIQILSEEKENLVFLLWGNYARAKKTLINTNKHKILEAAHPSPLSSYKGFFGCKNFSECNNWLKSKQIKPIDWKINE